MKKLAAKANFLDVRHVLGTQTQRYCEVVTRMNEKGSLQG